MNPDFLEKNQANFLDLDEKFLHFCEEHFTEKVKMLTDEELTKIFENYISLYKQLRGQRNIYYHFLGKILEDYLKNILFQYTKENIQAHFTLLTTTPEPTWAEEEKVSFLKLISLLQKGFTKDHPEFQQKLEQHEKWFRAFMFDYHGPQVLDIKYFLTKIDNYLSEEKSAEKELREMKEKRESFLQRQEVLAAELGLSSSEKKYFRTMQLLILWKEHKKKVHSKSHVPFQTVLMPEICRRINMPFQYARFLDDDELVDALRNKSVNSSQLQQRAEHFTIIHTPSGKQILSGNQALEYNEQLKPKYEFKETLTGSPASMGKHQGKVVLVMNEQDLSKVQTGNVLVTTMTKPQYILAMQRAGAFVTDSGGITCHAAIIAREMEKPCVVGTNMATKVLKDGDVVEVDANAGTVRILPS